MSYYGTTKKLFEAKKFDAMFSYLIDRTEVAELYLKEQFLNRIIPLISQGYWLRKEETILEGDIVFDWSYYHQQTLLWSLESSDYSDVAAKIGLRFATEVDVMIAYSNFSAYKKEFDTKQEELNDE